ncbi:MAG: hypothetical protein JWQ29_1973, partial [Phenylobacterium sp.]|nr:hypothetical protein [Phenylobacterium sp.]
MVATVSPPPPAVPDSLGELMRENALYYGDAIGVSSDARTVTHAEFYRRAHRIAAVWRQFGLKRSDRVAVLAMNCVEILEVFAASEVSGIPVVALNFRLAANEHKAILQDSTPTAIVFEAQYAAMIDGIRAETPSLKHFICISDAPAWAEDFENLIAGAPPHVEWDAFPPETLSCLLYTSGTTGKPKGCMIGHMGFRRLAQVLGEMISISPSDRALLMMPLFHIGAKAVQLAIHWAGAELFIHRAFDVEAILRTISEKKITVTHMAPTMVQALLDHPGIGDYDLSSLRVIFYSAAAMPEPVLRRGVELLGPVFVQAYAQTEVTGTVLPAKFHVLDGDARDR